MGLSRTLWLGFALVLLTPAAQAAPPVGPAQLQLTGEEAPPRITDARFRRRLSLLEQRRVALSVHQVLGTSAMVSVLAGATLSATNLGLQAGGLDADTRMPLTTAERVLNVASMASYSPAGIVAWLAPSPTGNIGDKRHGKGNTTRDQHILLSLLHGVFYATYWTTGLFSAYVAPPEHVLGLNIAHTAAGFAAGGFIAAASFTITTL